MMKHRRRYQLRPLLFTWNVFQAKVGRFGWQKTRNIPTVMLVNVHDFQGRFRTDHIWIGMSKKLRALNLQVGDVIEFVAYVDVYSKGYKGIRSYEKPVSQDYRIHRIRLAHKIEEGAAIGR